MVAAGGGRGSLSTALGTIAVAAASLNVVGGFVITDRMLRMFKTGPGDKKALPAATPGSGK